VNALKIFKKRILQKGLLCPFSFFKPSFKAKIGCLFKLINDKIYQGVVKNEYLA